MFNVNKLIVHVDHKSAKRLLFIESVACSVRRKACMLCTLCSSAMKILWDESMRHLEKILVSNYFLTHYILPKCSGKTQFWCSIINCNSWDIIHFRIFQIYFIVKERDIYAIIGGGDFVTIGRGKHVVADASKSFDPNTSRNMQRLTYDWSCRTSNDKPSFCEGEKGMRMFQLLFIANDIMGSLGKYVMNIIHNMFTYGRFLNVV